MTTPRGSAGCIGGEGTRLPGASEHLAGEGGGSESTTMLTAEVCRTGTPPATEAADDSAKAPATLPPLEVPDPRPDLEEPPSQHEDDGSHRPRNHSHDENDSNDQGAQPGEKTGSEAAPPNAQPMHSMRTARTKRGTRPTRGRHPKVTRRAGGDRHGSNRLSISRKQSCWTRPQ